MIQERHFLNRQLSPPNILPFPFSVDVPRPLIPTRSQSFNDLYYPPFQIHNVIVFAIHYFLLFCLFFSPNFFFFSSFSFFFPIFPLFLFFLHIYLHHVHLSAIPYSFFLILTIFRRQCYICKRLDMCLIFIYIYIHILKVESMKKIICIQMYSCAFVDMYLMVYGYIFIYLK